MRKIALLNQKGGVGKTTTAVNLAAALAEASRTVALIDLDPQAHATLHLGLAPEREGGSVYDVMTGDARLADVICQVRDNLYVAGSHIDLAAAEVELAGVVGRELILRDRLEELQAPWDYLLVDCPPSLGILTLNALAAVDEVIIPLQPHFLALHGLSKLLETMELVVQRVNPQLVLGGIVLCMYDASTRLAAEICRDVEAFFAKARGEQTLWATAGVFHTRIRRNIRLAEAPSFGQAIFDYAPSSHGAEDYRNLAAELLSREAVVSGPTSVGRAASSSTVG